MKLLRFFFSSSLLSLIKKNVVLIPCLDLWDRVSGDKFPSFDFEANSDQS